MPILSNYKRYDNTCARCVGFGTDKIIVDGKAYNSDFNEVNNEIIDVPGVSNEISLYYSPYFSPKTGNSKTISSYGYRSAVPMFCDISGNGEPGRVSMQDLFEPNISYTITSSTYLPFLNKINSNNGQVLNSFALYPILSTFKDLRILDITEKYVILIATTATTSTTYSHLIRFDKSNYSFSYINFSSYFYEDKFLQLLDKKDSLYFFKYNLQIGYIDVNQPNMEIVHLLKDPSVTNEKLNTTYNSLSSAYIRASISPKMGNGYYYTFDDAILSNSNNCFNMIAFKIDTENLSYIHTGFEVKNNLPKINLTINERCNQILFNQRELDNIFGNYRNFWSLQLFKISDYKFGCIFVNELKVSNREYSSLSQSYKSAYMIFQIDENNPLEVECINAQFFDYGYAGNPIYANGDFIFILENIASHMYHFNNNTNEMELVWNINTPNLVWASYYNNAFYWIDANNNYINYEIPGNNYRIVDSIDKKEFILDENNTPQETTYRLEVFDSLNRRIEARVKIQLDGGITFQNGDITKEVTTSNESAITETIIIKKASRSHITTNVIF